MPLHALVVHRTLQSIAWAGDLERSTGSLPGRASGRHQQLDELMAEEESNAELLGGRRISVQEWLLLLWLWWW